MLEINLERMKYALADLSARIPEYSDQMRIAGFRCCLLNDEWIEEHCSSENVATHKRYLVEYAREAFSSNDIYAVVFGDDLNCQSIWLRQLKAERLSKYGPASTLKNSGMTRHLIELSPGWREFVRVRESSSIEDMKLVSHQVACYEQRRSEELMLHEQSILQCCAHFAGSARESYLQSQFAVHLALALVDLGAGITTTIRRNQRLARDVTVSVVMFEVDANCTFVLLPTVVVSQNVEGSAFGGTMGIGFRLMTKAALTAPTFEFGRDTVVPLYELLPNKFKDYGRFDRIEELSLNFLAWTNAMRILMPDVLRLCKAT